MQMLETFNQSQMSFTISVNKSDQNYIAYNYL
jgi:hypothetical protein